MMKRRTILKRTGVGLSAVGVTGLSGCSGDSNDDESEPLPELELSGQRFQSSVEQLAVTGFQTELRRGQQHEDIHFAVTPTIENTGDQQVTLGDYQYEIRLFSAEDIDITPGNTWTARADDVPPGETGTILLQVSFISEEGVDPEDVDRYEVSLSCDSGNSGSYC